MVATPGDRLSPPVVVNHWFRHGRYEYQDGRKRAAPILICSPRVAELQQRIQDCRSDLHLLRGFEESILPLIGSFCGLAVIWPCSCCRDEPFRFCGQLNQVYRVGPIPSQEEKGLYAHLPISMELYSNLDKEGFLFYSERAYSSGGSHEKRSNWDQASRDLYETITQQAKEKGQEIWFYGLYPSSYPIKRQNIYGGISGEGYVVCTSKGLFSRCYNMEWLTLPQLEVRCERRRFGNNDKAQYYVYFVKKSTRKGAKKQLCYQLSNDKDTWAVETDLELQVEFRITEEARVRFHLISQFQEFMRVVLAKRQKPVHCQPIPTRDKRIARFLLD